MKSRNIDRMLSHDILVEKAGKTLFLRAHNSTIK
uniref:Uncharacterized protein n=1 Tax=Rhizophora mucronata TaxID=61149 RepID=A0A2P2Q4B2_RHIMU